MPHEKKLMICGKWRQNDQSEAVKIPNRHIGFFGYFVILVKILVKKVAALWGVAGHII